VLAQQVPVAPGTQHGTAADLQASQVSQGCDLGRLTHQGGQAVARLEYLERLRIAVLRYQLVDHRLAVLLAVRHPRRCRVLGDAVGYVVDDQFVIDLGLE